MSSHAAECYKVVLADDEMDRSYPVLIRPAAPVIEDWVRRHAPVDWATVLFRPEVRGR